MRVKQDGLGSSWFGGSSRHASIQELFSVRLISSDTSIWSEGGWIARENGGESILLVCYRGKKRDDEIGKADCIGKRGKEKGLGEAGTTECRCYGEHGSVFQVCSSLSPSLSLYELLLF